MLGSAALPDRLPEEAAKRALWFLTGLPPDAPARALPQPEYDPAQRSLAERERAEAAKPAARGEEVSARTVKRKRQRYEAGGAAAGHRGERPDVHSHDRARALADRTPPGRQAR